MKFELLTKDPTTRARAGLLHTAHGVIETPVFMPVGTQATVKGLTQRDLAEDLGVKILLANTYHLFLRPGPELIRGLGGLRRFMSWPNAILTDSAAIRSSVSAGCARSAITAWCFNRTSMALCKRSRRNLQWMRNSLSAATLSWHSTNAPSILSATNSPAKAWSAPCAGRGWRTGITAGAWR